jgi:hypothetical protein
LLRPTFEASFRAGWILDPEDGRVRRARGLRCEIRDAYEQRAHRAAFKKLPDPEVWKLIRGSEQATEKGAFDTYRAEAAKLGWRFDKISRDINLIEELPKMNLVKAQPNFAPILEATWRQLSGFEHGFSWALLSGTDRQVELEVPGGVGLHLVIRDEAFVNAAKMTYFLMLEAYRLFRRRHFERGRSQPVR